MRHYPLVIGMPVLLWSCDPARDTGSASPDGSPSPQNTASVSARNMSFEWRFDPSTEEERQVRASLAKLDHGSSSPIPGSIGVIHDLPLSTGPGRLLLIADLPGESASSRIALFVIDLSQEQVSKPYVVGPRNWETFWVERIEDVDEDGRADIAFCYAPREGAPAADHILGFDGSEWYDIESYERFGCSEDELPQH